MTVAHKYVQVAGAIDEFGVIDAERFAVDRAGSSQSVDRAAGLGCKLTFAIEGTGSYGAGLTAAVYRRGIGVIEVLRTDRRDRRPRGKNDTIERPEVDATSAPSRRRMSPSASRYRLGGR